MIDRRVEILNRVHAVAKWLQAIGDGEAEYFTVRLPDDRLDRAIQQERYEWLEENCAEHLELDRMIIFAQLADATHFQLFWQ